MFFLYLCKLYPLKTSWYYSQGKCNYKLHCNSRRIITKYFMLKWIHCSFEIGCHMSQWSKTWKKVHFGRTRHSGPENFKKSRQKNFWNQINLFYFSWNCIFGVFNFFLLQKLIFVHFWKLQKMEFGQKLIYLISRVF